jgi:hypothetical protein
MSETKLTWRTVLTWTAAFWLVLALETRLPLSAGEHKLVLIGLTLAFFALIGKWVTAHPGVEHAAVPVRVTTLVMQPRRPARSFRRYRQAASCRRLYRTTHRNEVH